MCRLITTILDDITDYNNKSVEYSELLTFLNKCVLNKDNENIYTNKPFPRHFMILSRLLSSYKFFAREANKMPLLETKVI